MGPRSVELAGLPYTSGRRGIAAAAAVLRTEGLLSELATAVHDRGDLLVSRHSGDRGRSGLLDEPGLVTLVGGVRSFVSSVLGREGRSLLVGGDCPVLLGGLAALEARFGRSALYMVDGHEDAWPPHDSPTGEASDSEVALALGLVQDVPGELMEVLPRLDTAAVALMGARDAGELAAADVPSLRDRVLLYSDRDIGRLGALRAAREALARVRAAAPFFWLHLDLDALATDALPAVDYPQAGGLDWEELLVLSSTAWSDPACAGMSLVIYNPDLDPDRRHARRIARFVHSVLEPNAGTPSRGDTPASDSGTKGSSGSG